MAWPLPPPPAVTDGDGDGWTPPDDCDDTDATINPDAVDVPYNGIDEDCSGSDERDLDGDGHDWDGDGGDDCNDANAAVSPDAPELCDNGTDEDCDAEIDEFCAAVDDPGDPDGFAWACGVSGGAPSGTLALVVAWLWLSRAGCATSRR